MKLLRRKMKPNTRKKKWNLKFSWIMGPKIKYWDEKKK